MTNLGPLTTTYTPISSMACQSIHLATDIEGFWLERGEQLAGCFPARFTPGDGYYYSPGICQEGYTYACMTGVGGPGTTAATCCPSALTDDVGALRPNSGFTCRATRPENDNAACQSVLSSDSSYIGDLIAYLDGISTKTGTTSTLIGAGELVYAAGVPVRRAATDGEWIISSTKLDVTTAKMEPTATTTESVSDISKPARSTTNTNTLQVQRTSRNSSSRGHEDPGDNGKAPTDDSTLHTGLVTGSKAAVAVGTILGVLLFLLVIVAIHLTRKRKRRVSSPPQRSPEAVDTEEGPSQRGLKLELEGQGGVREMNACREPSELTAHREPAELY
ncbi:hypothetical protein O1611_g6091 [Lasiodiplodia mahajangana]|uniref:Uncharacterized protein n=1 Tax=Lasiodiplodia mahajangana TaxID=1108764 RepID=A0ACC2JJB2_9PEZI|nr:hypothetical protein O1611_g6091 [Lasiodiplodia mahajangana]